MGGAVVRDEALSFLLDLFKFGDSSTPVTSRSGLKCNVAKSRHIIARSSDALCTVMSALATYYDEDLANIIHNAFLFRNRYVVKVDCMYQGVKETEMD